MSAVTVSALAEDYTKVIKRSIAAHPRSLQKRIGPSEIGMDCTRRLLHKLNGDNEPERGPAWKPAIGTAVHTQLEKWFEAENKRIRFIRWVCEHRVTVGEINGETIAGSCDLFDTITRTVIDHKIVGPRQLLDYRANGPSNQYRVQAHLYGLGFFRDPEPWGTPTEVMIAFLPRDGELSRAYYWHEPWQPAIAIEALNRVNQCDRERRELGMDIALQLYPECANPFCPWCSNGPSARTGGTIFNPEYRGH